MADVKVTIAGAATTSRDTMAAGVVVAGTVMVAVNPDMATELSEVNRNRTWLWLAITGLGGVEPVTRSRGAAVVLPSYTVKKSAVVQVRGGAMVAPWCPVGGE